MSCPWIDDTVARFLDGDLLHDARRGHLDEHVNGCPECRRELARSRHLDALLAVHAHGEDVDRDRVDRILERSLYAAERLFAAERDAERRQAKRRSPWHLRLPAALTAAAAAGFLAAWLLRDRPPAPAATPPLPTAQQAPIDPGPPVQDGDPVQDGNPVQDGDPVQDGNVVQDGNMVLLPLPARRVDEGSSPRRRRSRAPATLTRHAEVVATAAILTEPERIRAMTMQTLARTLALGCAPPVALAAVRRRQDAAATALLASPHPAACRELARVIGPVPGSRLSDELLRRAQHSSEFVARLARHVDARADGSLLMTAAKLGDDGLDRRLLAVLRQRPDLLASIAAALVDSPVREQSVGMLLDLWNLGVRLTDGGAEGLDDDTIAATWFRPLPPEATDQLVERVAKSRHAVVRHRCLLALRARADAQALPALLRLIEAPRRVDAELAAHALGGYPPTPAIGRALRQASRKSRRPDLLWVALLDIDDAQTRQRCQQLDLSEEALQMLLVGGFGPRQVAAASTILRNLPLPQLR